MTHLNLGLKMKIYMSLTFFPAGKEVSSKHQHVPVTPQLPAASPVNAAATPESCKAAPFMGWNGDEGGGGSLVGSRGKNSYVSMLSCVQLFVIQWIIAQPGSSVHQILPARILEWVAIPFSRGSSQTRD